MKGASGTINKTADAIAYFSSENPLKSEYLKQCGEQRSQKTITATGSITF